MRWILLIILLSATASALTITAPNNNDVVGGTITFNASCTNCTNIRFSVDGNLLGSNTYITSSIVDGTHALTATADVVNSTENAAITFITDNSAPSLSLTSSGSTVTYAFTEPHFLRGYIETNASGSFSNSTISQNGTITMSASGTARLTVFDTLGNFAQTSISVSITVVDTTAPTVTIPDSSTILVSGRGSVKVNYSYIESNPSIAVIQFLDSSNNVAQSQTISLSSANQSRADTISLSLSDGLYSLRIYVNDTAKNSGSATKSSFLYADTHAPNITFTLSSTNVVIGTTITPTCTAIDSSTSYGGTINITTRNIDTTRTGTRTAICEAFDSMLYSALATVSYKVNATSTLTNYTYNLTTQNTTTNYTYRGINATSGKSTSTTNTTTTKTTNGTTTTTTTTTTKDDVNELVNQLNNLTAESEKNETPEETSEPLLSKINLKDYKWLFTSLAVVFTLAIIIFIIYMMSRPKTLNDEIDQDLENRASDK